MCLLRGTDWVFIYNSTFCPHSVFMCSVWIWEQTAIISLYSINWLVFITETDCVYCAVRTGSLYTASLTFSNSTFCPHSAFMCFVWVWEQTALFSVNNINCFFFVVPFVLKKVAYTCSWMLRNVRISKPNVTAPYATRPETWSSSAVITSNLDYLNWLNCPHIYCHYLRTIK